MYERASIHDLHVDVRSQPGVGTRVEIIVPVPRQPLVTPELQIGPAVHTGR
jgi:hypothetical protein